MIRVSLISLLFVLSVFSNNVLASNASPNPVKNISPVPSYIFRSESVGVYWQNLLNGHITTTIKEVVKDVDVPSEYSSLQLKYADLLNLSPTMLPDNTMLESIDNWYGTRYVYGGTTKRGIDCSAFTRQMYKEVYNTELPRTAREQYYAAQKISLTELKEGDLVFFNTRGGVSHVGMYLRNNKFVHSSCRHGVAISDLYDSYYISRFIGAARVVKAENRAIN
jgi:cell wall-associated NlpC family hydrolase